MCGGKAMSGTSGGDPLTGVVEQLLDLGDSGDIGESAADVFAVCDSFGEPADHRACLVQLPLFRLRRAIDLRQVTLHGVNPAVDLRLGGLKPALTHDVAEDERVV